MNTIRCAECGAQVAPQDMNFHLDWHSHIARLIHIASAGARK